MIELCKRNNCKFYPHKVVGGFGGWFFHFRQHVQFPKWFSVFSGGWFSLHKFLRGIILVTGSIPKHRRKIYHVETSLGGGFLHISLCSPRNLGKMDPIWRWHMFHSWVETQPPTRSQLLPSRFGPSTPLGDLRRTKAVRFHPKTSEESTQKKTSFILVKEFTFKNFQKQKTKLYTTKSKFNTASDRWWLEDDPFLLGFGNFSGGFCC